MVFITSFMYFCKKTLKGWLFFYINAKRDINSLIFIAVLTV